MSEAVFGGMVNFIWTIADECLRDVFVRGKYRDVILPMTVLRRLDAVLEPTKAAAVAGVSARYIAVAKQLAKLDAKLPGSGTTARRRPSCCPSRRTAS